MSAGGLPLSLILVSQIAPDRLKWPVR